MKTGKLTPRTNATVRRVRYTGNFGQPTGFGSVLEVSQHEDGTAHLTLCFKNDLRPDEQMWSVQLTNEQRNHLAAWLAQYQPRLFEVVEDFSKAEAL